MVVGELAGLPHLPQLPDRGAGADAVGRTAALLVDLHVDVHAGRWRLVPRPSHDERRAAEMLERDLDALEEAAGRHPGPLKLQVVGPWTLATTLELARGEKALADRGATADLASSLAEGLARHVADVRRRIPKAERVLVQVDEPLLPAALAGHVPSASGWDRLPVPEPRPAQDALAEVLRAGGGDAGVWCDVPGAPVAFLRGAGARFVAVDAAVLETIPEEDLGEAIEDGAGLLLGLVPAPPGCRDHVDDLAAPARRQWERLGLGQGHWAAVVVTPSVDLSQLGVHDAREVLRRCGDVARSLQAPEGETYDEAVTAD